MKKTFLLFFFLFYASTIHAQIIVSGKVSDKATGKALTGAALSFAGGKMVVITDESGFYQTQYQGENQFKIKVSYVGYHAVDTTVNLTEKHTWDFQLTASDISLDQVLITGNSQSGYRSSQAGSGPLGQLALKNMPFSMQVTSGELIANRGVHTLADALQTNPTAALLMSSNTYSSLSRMMIRGFTAADQSDLRDGMVDRSFTFPHLENVERIEVMNGLSSFLYGFSSIGGTINYVSKEPTATPMASLGLGVYGGGINYVHADLGGPFAAEKRLGYRINAYREDGGTYISGGHQQRTLFSGVFKYKITENIRLKADITQQDYNVKGLQTYFSLPAGATSLPKALDPTRQYGQDWTYNESAKTQVGLAVDAKLNSIFSLRAAFRYNDMYRKYSYVALALLDQASYKQTYWDSPRQYETTHSGYAYLDARFTTGAVAHAASLGYSATEYLYKRGVDISTVLGTSLLDSPDAFAVPSYAAGITTFQKQIMKNMQISDRITLAEKWQAIIGLNYAFLTQRAGGVSTAISTSNFTQSRLTPSFSLLYKPINGVSVYGSYMQGLASGGIAPVAAKNANQQLSPSVSDQYEVGAKVTVKRLDMTLAFFRINKINEYINPSDSVYAQDGRQLHQGVEFTATGKISSQLTLVTGFTLMKAELTGASNNPAIEGKIPVNVPRQQFRVHLEYALPMLKGLVISGGPNYFGKRAANTLNTLFLPSATTLDAGFRYGLVLGKLKTNIHLNVGNLLNISYWANYRDGDGLQLGAPRIVSFGVKFTI